jgi:hypothetical protein
MKRLVEAAQERAERAVKLSWLTSLAVASRLSKRNQE